MKSLVNYIHEGFVINSQGILVFDPEETGFINTKFGKYKSMTPYVGKLTHGKFYAAYSKAKDLDKENYDEVLRAIKGKSNKIFFDTDSYQKFIKRTAIYLSKIITQEEIDSIILMDSSSTIVADLANEMNKNLPTYYQLHSFDKVIFKNPNIDEIVIDTMGKDIGTRMKGLMSDLKRIKASGTFNMKEIKQPQTRKYIKNWLSVRPGFEKHVFDKNVCLIDDYVTSGATLNASSEILSNMGAKKVIGLAILKGN